jgi:hypothetical protein
MNKQACIMHNVSCQTGKLSLDLTSEGHNQIEKAANEIISKALQWGIIKIHHSPDNKSVNTARFLKKCLDRKGFKAIRTLSTPELQTDNLDSVEEMIVVKTRKAGFHVFISHRNCFGSRLAEGEIEFAEISKAEV